MHEITLFVYIQSAFINVLKVTLPRQIIQFIYLLNYKNRYIKLRMKMYIVISGVETTSNRN